ncbi:hypothetical protein BDN72DRAFT_426103 [Pluteus cervinus]|uniref:Uncharacterized protein n=1 Tax=Pluteus cervinus TaxID=181527 RepID=A0ACD3B201_9AGAR|nr:hypothetical protein BDN72DRAFT_426103 [Pluteus cervinus]
MDFFSSLHLTGPSHIIICLSNNHAFHSFPYILAHFIVRTVPMGRQFFRLLFLVTFVYALSQGCISLPQVFSISLSITLH